jgi:hypothetical protein
MRKMKLLTPKAVPQGGIPSQGNVYYLCRETFDY